MRFLVSLVCVSSLGWQAQPPPERPVPSPLDLVSALETVMADAIARAEPSVVAINRHKGDNPRETLAVRGKSRPTGTGFELRGPRGRFLREDPSEDISLDFGSGVVIGSEGQILTAYHVVKGAARLDVRATDGQRFDCEIIAADPRSDLAVIVPVNVPSVPPPRLSPIAIGDAGRLRKGAFLVALGNPFNAARDGKPAAAWGILSNVARKVEPELDEGSTMGPRRLGFPNYPTLLQLDSKLNLGMSGGAVVNMKGELVGLTTMASSPMGFDAMAGYAIPMDRLSRRAVETLKQGKEIEYGLLGIVAHQGNTNRVDEVTPGSPADQGQLQANDEIVAVNETPVHDFNSLILAINTYAPGDEVRLKVRRAGSMLTKTVVLAKHPVNSDMIATNRPPPWRGLRVDYLSTVYPRSMVPPFADPSPGGVVVSEVVDDSPAARAGLKRFQIIQKVGKTPISTPPQFAQAVERLKGAVNLATDQGPVSVAE
jgi:S1-C subfamily serine protease